VSPPVPGRRGQESASAGRRPVTSALDLLGRRWALRVLWELRDGPCGARALQANSDRMSSSVLYERLRELTEAGLIGQTTARAYELTDLGRALWDAIDPLAAWADEWAARRPGGDGVARPGHRRRA